MRWTFFILYQEDRAFAVIVSSQSQSGTDKCNQQLIV